MEHKQPSMLFGAIKTGADKEKVLKLTTNGIVVLSGLLAFFSLGGGHIMTLVIALLFIVGALALKKAKQESIAYAIAILAAIGVFQGLFNYSNAKNLLILIFILWMSLRALTATRIR